MESVYYGTLLTQRGRDAEREPFVEQYLGLEPDADAAALLTAHGIDEADRWDWEALSRPYRDRVFTGRADFTAWLLDYLARDVVAAKQGTSAGR